MLLYLLYSPQVKNPGSPEAARVLALLCLGEIGRTGSLGGSKEVQGVILEAIASTNEEVRHIRFRSENVAPVAHLVCVFS